MYFLNAELFCFGDLNGVSAVDLILHPSERCTNESEYKRDPLLLLYSFKTII